MQMRKELEAGTWRGQAKDAPDGKSGAKKPVPAPYMSAQYKEDSMRTTGESTAAGRTDLVLALGPALLMVLPYRGKGCLPYRIDNWLKCSDDRSVGAGAGAASRSFTSTAVGVATKNTRIQACPSRASPA